MLTLSENRFPGFFCVEGFKFSSYKNSILGLTGTIKNEKLTDFNKILAKKWIGIETTDGTGQKVVTQGKITFTSDFYEDRILSQGLKDNCLIRLNVQINLPGDWKKINNVYLRPIPSESKEKEINK